MPNRPILAYTVAFDPQGSGGYRQMARMLGASMARTYFGGDFLIIRNSPEPLFLIQREGISEIFVETQRSGGGGRELESQANLANGWKAMAATKVIGEQVQNYSWVLYLDVDCLALRNLDHLFELDDEGETAILYQPETTQILDDSDSNSLHSAEPGMESLQGTDSGTWAVRADVYHEVMAEWQRIQQEESPSPARTHCAWNRLIWESAANRGWNVRPFEAHEIQFPLHLDLDWRKYSEAALIHCKGARQRQKIEFMFGMYMQKFFNDSKGTLPGILDT